MRGEPLATRVWQKVNVDGPVRSAELGPCWEWSGKRRRDGYGIIYLDSTRAARAHRVAWELSVGPIPDGMFVCHRCDNPPCLRIEHLFLGTCADNVDDMWQKGRARPGVIPGGVENVNAKLTPETAAKIRAMYVPGKVSQQAIADLLGVSQSAVSCVIRARTWKGVN